MANIVFHQTNDIHQGIDKVALRVWDETNKKYSAPVAWNGVTAINESPSGAETTKLYADNKQYGGLTSKEEFALTLECYCTPTEFDACDGTVGISGAHGFSVGMQNRKKFALVYREFVDGGDRENDNKGIYHIILGCKASPSSKDHSTVNDSPEAQTLSYEISTTPEVVKFATGVEEDEVIHLVIDGSDSMSDNLYEELYSTTAAWTTVTGTNKIDLSTLYSDAT